MKLSIEFVIFFTKCYFLVLFPKNFHIQVYHNFMEKEKKDCKAEERNRKDQVYEIVKS
ncbi:hypothetical protein HMPREF0833_10324 [Streptococcus parasanguinis ATCC 15912]|uniref:Uncharacterized protein n=1 Tax=Streptococcus parasanguinis (strain ATCC 15912 / DSM 6778 / CIP 104372 / LMG 14537) TaxID=760570 RepID=F8DG35_STREP|nr:hypothetical protein HMPREF0833_10324 [Streptococcus parasanguinis ATCC 15912]